MRTMRFIVKRLVLIPLSLFVVISLAFVLIELMPGDPATTIAGSFASEEELQRIRQELGLDRPFAARYASYIGDVATGDLGTSFYSRRPIGQEIVERLPATLELIALSLAFAGLVGIVIGTVGAYFARRGPDRVARVVITATQSVPDFLLALLLIYFLFFVLRIAPPPIGRMGLGSGAIEHVTGFLLIDTLLAGDLGAFVTALKHLLLPVLALGLVYSAYLAKTARATMAGALSSQQVEFARACGLPERKVIRYAFLQARTPIITYLAILFGALVGGAAIVETIFSWQGVGQWALEAILKLDIPAIQGFIVAAGVVTIVLYLVLDIVVLLLDPRVSYE